MTILEKLTKNKKRLDTVNVRLDALKVLYDVASVEEHEEGFALDSDILLTNLLSNNKYATVSHVVYKKGNQHYPAHTHEDSVEYLIVTHGKLFIKFQEGSSRIVFKGACCNIPRGHYHSGFALEDGTELVAICIPPEHAYKIGDR